MQWDLEEEPTYTGNNRRWPDKSHNFHGPARAFGPVFRRIAAILAVLGASIWMLNGLGCGGGEYSSETSATAQNTISISLQTTGFLAAEEFETGGWHL